jgi:hypothetical protein
MINPRPGYTSAIIHVVLREGVPVRSLESWIVTLEMGYAEPAIRYSPGRKEFRCLPPNVRFLENIAIKATS